MFCDLGDENWNLAFPRDAFMTKAFFFLNFSKCHFSSIYQKKQCYLFHHFFVPSHVDTHVLLPALGAQDGAHEGPHLGGVSAPPALAREALELGQVLPSLFSRIQGTHIVEKDWIT